MRHTTLLLWEMIDSHPWMSVFLEKPREWKMVQDPRSGGDDGSMLDGARSLAYRYRRQISEKKTSIRETRPVIRSSDENNGYIRILHSRERDGPGIERRGEVQGMLQGPGYRALLHLGGWQRRIPRQRIIIQRSGGPSGGLEEGFEVR